MSTATDTEMATKRGGIAGLFEMANGVAARLPEWPLQILARLTLATIFWRSGRTKVDGFALDPDAIFMFQEEFKLPIIPPVPAAYMATIAEHVFPVLLVLGLATRLSAAALLTMTLVIQIFVYPDAYITHGLWAIGLLYLIKHGGGTLSLDHVIGKNSSN